MVIKLIMAFFIIPGFLYQESFPQPNTNIYTSPKQNEIGISRDAAIIIKFDSLVNINSISNNVFKVSGINSGMHNGMIAYDEEQNTLSFQPDNNFFSGEVVKVSCGPLLSLTGDTIKSYNWQFTVGMDNKTKAKFNSPVITSFNSDFAQAIDIDRDGDIDLISIDGYVIYNKGNGIFSEPELVPEYNEVFLYCDINNDNYLDMLQQYENGTLILTDNKNGGNEFYAFLAADNGIIVNYGDFNNDGLIDLINLTLKSWNVIWNTGTGNF